MVLDRVASNNVSFSDNYAFYCLIVHKESLTINVQSCPHCSNSTQHGPGRMLLPHWKLLLSFFSIILFYSSITVSNCNSWDQLLWQQLEWKLWDVRSIGSIYDANLYCQQCEIYCNHWTQHQLPHNLLHRHFSRRNTEGAEINIYVHIFRSSHYLLLWTIIISQQWQEKA